jgi:hypothetical protein
MELADFRHGTKVPTNSKSPMRKQIEQLKFINAEEKRTVLMNSSIECITNDTVSRLENALEKHQALFNG